MSKIPEDYLTRGKLPIQAYDGPRLDALCENMAQSTSPIIYDNHLTLSLLLNSISNKIFTYDFSDTVKPLQ